jgi:hypothetical protein
MPKRNRKSTRTSHEVLKTFIRTNNPKIKTERKEYAQDPTIKATRNRNNQKRRTTCSTALSLLKTQTLTDDEDNRYCVKNNRMIKMKPNKSKCVLKCNKKGEIFEFPFKTEDELDDPRFDEPIKAPKHKNDLYENLKKLLDGDEELAALLKTKKKLVEVPVDEDDLYWKNLDEDEKKALLKKVKKE